MQHNIHLLAVHYDYDAGAHLPSFLPSFSSDILVLLLAVSSMQLRPLVRPNVTYANYSDVHQNSFLPPTQPKVDKKEAFEE